jgi:hypothetical protein
VPRAGALRFACHLHAPLAFHPALADFVIRHSFGDSNFVIRHSQITLTPTLSGVP